MNLKFKFSFESNFLLKLDKISSFSINFCSISFLINVSSSGLFNSKSMNKLFASLSFIPKFLRIFLKEDLFDVSKLSI